VHFVSRPWLERFPHLGIRLIIALAMTIAVSLLVFAALPAGRLAMRSSKEMLKLLVKRERESVV
jgi:hypothetical protein